jgi:uncharacterized membrane protein
LSGVSPYRDPHVVVALAAIAGAAVAVILVVNSSLDGAGRTIATLSVAVVLAIALMTVIRLARRR